MAILIDPPLWPAHGTVFSHLVSDTSIRELLAFANLQGLPERAFDRDHYDVPQERYEALVAAGALPVTATDLVRRLVRSGLRVPARERPERLDAVLLARWDCLLPGCGALGGELLARWSEPHRRYHDRAHLLAILRALDTLTGANEQDRTFRPVYLAAWFHDAIYNGSNTDEKDSAALAAALLPTVGIDPAEIREVVRLVELTIEHRPAFKDLHGQLICDADLEVLGRPAGAYSRYAEAVRREYSKIPDAIFARGRAAILRKLLAADSLYSGDRARALWELPARENLERELEDLVLRAGVENPGNHVR